MPSVSTLEITDGYIPSVMFLRETFFLARESVGVSVDVWFFLFTTELATEMGFTDDCYTDGCDPSVLFLPTECITVTDGIIPSTKLYNVVVTYSNFDYISRKLLLTVSRRAVINDCLTLFYTYELLK